MNRLVPLMQREWLQHRFGWALLTLLPLALAVLLSGFGQVQIESDAIDRAGAALPTLLTFASIAGTTLLLFVIMGLTSLIIVSGLARRDHADRSIEFWLSLPTSHSASLGAPLFVHLLLAPAAALVIGLAGGYAVSLLLVGRLVGFGAWFALPWGDIVVASLMLTVRLLAGLPLALLWLAPIILLAVLNTAWFGRWAWVILAVGLGLGSLLLKQVFGQPILADIVTALLHHAGRAFFSGSAAHFAVHNSQDAYAALRAVPAWVIADIGAALRDLASPLLLGGLLFAAACFAALVDWRRRGAGAA